MGPVPALARKHEDRWLADLRAWLVQEERVRELQQQLADAEAFHVHNSSRTTEPSAGSRTRRPSRRLKRFNPEMLAGSLERPWHRRPDAAEEPPVAWQDRQQPSGRNDVQDPVGDAAGEISELVETGEGAAS
jgi:hypothetical protein